MTITNPFMRTVAALKRLLFGVPLAFVFSCLLTPSSSAQGTTNFTSTNIIHFEKATYFASEDSLFARIGVLRDGPLTNFVSVEYTMIDGTAVTGVHYYRTSG